MRLRLRIGSHDAMRDFEIEAEEGATVLDCLEIVRGTRDATLRYRHSCHHGSCGTCGALVNGKPALMCLTRVSELGTAAVTVEPLARATRVGDIAVKPSRLFETMPDWGYLRESDGASVMESCIECGLCIEACPVDAPFVGPAALAAADREREERPERRAPMLAFAARPEGAAACRRAFECSRVCPQKVAPGRRITALLRDLSR